MKGERGASGEAGRKPCGRGEAVESKCELSIGRKVSGTFITESLILAQNERWRRVLSMQVERQQGATLARVANG